MIRVQYFSWNLIPKDAIPMIATQETKRRDFRHHSQSLLRRSPTASFGGLVAQQLYWLMEISLLPQPPAKTRFHL